MEKDNVENYTPLVFRNNSDSGSQKSNSVKSFTAEPEMEDCNDTTMLKILIKELGISECLSSDIDPLKHDSSTPGGCVHCRLLQKLTHLQADITKMNQEICATHEILSLKRDQNGDLKGMIERIEGSMARAPEDDFVIDQSSSHCSCGHRCTIF